MPAPAIRLPRKIEIWPIGKIKPYPDNARRHSQLQINRLVKCMERYGWTIPCYVSSKGDLATGHARVIAAKQMNLKEVPVIVADHLSDEEIRAYRLEDNRLTELSSWDRETLASEFGALKKAKDYQPIGWNPDEFKAILGTFDLTTENRGASPAAMGPVPGGAPSGGTPPGGPQEAGNGAVSPSPGDSGGQPSGGSERATSGPARQHTTCPKCGHVF